MGRAREDSPVTIKKQHRVPRGEFYYALDPVAPECIRVRERGDDYDNRKWEAGLYFHDFGDAAMILLERARLMLAWADTPEAIHEAHKTIERIRARLRRYMEGMTVE